MPGDDANVVNGIHVPKGTAGKATAKNKLSFSEAFQGPFFFSSAVFVLFFMRRSRSSGFLPSYC
jgi:hypothetical protein